MSTATLSERGPSQRTHVAPPDEPPRAAPVVDAHAHVFCWGEDPAEGYLCEKIRRSWITRLVMRLFRIDREPGATLTDRIRGKLFRHLEESSLDHAVILAQDAVYRDDGTRDDAATPFYVSNDYVLRLSRENEKIIPGVSINPHRADARAELDRCHNAGARLVKIHTAIQGVDPSLAKFDEFYRHACERGMVLMFHTGYEHSSPVISQTFTDPLRLARPLDHGLTVIAAHCGTCAFFDPEDYYPNFVAMMKRHPNLYGDTSILATSIRWFALRKVSREPAWLRARLIHGSDYPLPPSRAPYLLRTGPLPAERRNPFDLDLRIKRAFRLGDGYESRILNLLNIPTPECSRS